MVAGPFCYYVSVSGYEMYSTDLSDTRGDHSHIYQPTRQPRVLHVAGVLAWAPLLRGYPAGRRIALLSFYCPGVMETKPLVQVGLIDCES